MKLYHILVLIQRASQDRLTVNPEVYPSLRIAVHKIYKEGGILGLYAGLGPTLIGMLPYSTCYYFMYETIKKSYCQAQKKESLSRAEMLLVGAFSGKILESNTQTPSGSDFLELYYDLPFCGKGLI